MSRQPEMEAILQARYELEMCEPEQKTESRARLSALLDKALAEGEIKSLSHRDLLQILAAPYQEFKRAKQKEERSRLSRLR